MDVFQILSSIFMLLCSIIGIICSVIFIAIVAVNRRCRTLVICITFNTVLAGFLINIVYASQAIYQLLSDTSDILCPFRGFLLHCSAGLFYHTLCIQAFYRLFVTVYAQRRYLQSTPFLISIIIIQWIISVTFGIPILLMNRIKFQPQGRICQAAIDDLFGFTYLASFIYFFPVPLLICIYLRMVNYMKRNIITAGVRRHIIEQTRQRRELRFVRRILVLLFILILTGFPYFVFFLLVNIGHLPLPSFAHRFCFMFISFGLGFAVVLTLIHTDDVRKNLLNSLRRIFPWIQNTRVRNTNNIPVAFYRTATV